MIDLLKTMIEASKAATLPLDMGGWHCGTSCCLCGDVAVYESPVCSDDVAILCELAEQFAVRLESKPVEMFGGELVAASIFALSSDSRSRLSCQSKNFTDEELKHPHLTTDHSDRAIAIDYIEMVIRKCEERLGE